MLATRLLLKGDYQLSFQQDIQAFIVNNRIFFEKSRVRTPTCPDYPLVIL